MNWNKLTAIDELDTIKEKSFERPQLLFKHSTRCGISASALHTFENGWDTNLDVDLYYLDLLNHRDVSNAIAEKFNQLHQSPQVLVIDKGEVVENVTHYAINPSKIASKL